MKDILSQRWVKSYPEKVDPLLETPQHTLYQLLEKTEATYPDRIAIITEQDEKISYKQFKNNVDRLASAWKELGVQKGERIGLMLPNVKEYFITYYAAVKLGLIIVQVNPHYTVRELLQIVENSRLQYIVAKNKDIKKIDEAKNTYSFQQVFAVESPVKDEHSYKVIDDLIEQSTPLSYTEPIDLKEDVAVIQYTGGTTGVMKGAMLTHSNLVANAYQSFQIYGGAMKRGKERFLIATPLYHVYAMTSGMNFSIYIGATSILIENYNVNITLEKIKMYQPSYFPGVPRMYNDFINHPEVQEYGLDCLKFCSSGSAPNPEEVMTTFQRLTGAQIAEGFGLSETSPSTHRNPPGGKIKLGSVGLPLPGTNCKIVDEKDQEVAVGEVGELLIKGPQVMKGYWNNPEETKKALKDGWLYTADLARMDEEGYFYIVGRKVEMIITNGFNVYPQEVENVLYEHAAVIEAAVLGIPDEQAGEIVKAFVVIKESAKVTEEELKNHCYEALTPYKVPREFEFIQALPRNNVGKVLKNKLLEKELEAK